MILKRAEKAAHFSPHPPSAPSPQGEGFDYIILLKRGIGNPKQKFCTFNSYSQAYMVYITKSFQGILNFGAKKEIFENARELRKKQTEAEKVLWEMLRSRRCKGLKFRRQHPVKEFILDFYCHEYLLGVEVDGAVHENEAAKEYDQNRTAELESLGITILRFTNEEVLSDPASVKVKILNKSEQLQSERATKPNPHER